MVNTALSRIQVVEAPPAAPGHCAICGTTQGPMVDFGMDFEFYGVVYFCVDNCLVELANSFDYHSPRQWQAAVDYIERLKKERDELREQNDQLRSTVSSLNSFAGLAPIDRVPELDVDALHQEPESAPEQLAFDFTEEGDGTPESNDERRSPDVFDDERDISIDDILADI